MNIEEIRKGAPEGATHYMQNKYTGITYLKMGFNFYDNYYSCKAWTKRNGWCGQLTIKKCWFFGTYYRVFFDSNPWAKTDAHVL